MIPSLQNPKTIHETVIRDIVDIISDGIKQHEDYDGFINIGKGARKSFRSISKASSNLILTFPVLVSQNMDIETACMLAKSHERKCAAMMQMLFSALSVSDDETNVYGYLKQFHTNLNFDEDDLNVDNFVDAMDSIADKVDESADIAENRLFKEKAYAMLMEDVKNLDYTLPDNFISEHGINDYRVSVKSGPGGTVRVMAPIHEGGNNGTYGPNFPNDGTEFLNRRINRAMQMTRAQINDLRRDIRNIHTGGGGGRSRESDRMQDYKNRMEGLGKAHDMARNGFIATDVKKANELLPTMMVINFYSPAVDEPVVAVIGVKAKLYPVPGDEIIKRIVTRNKDNNGFHNFLRATTREISFFKDFVFAVDKAKIDALSSSRRGSDSKIWKLLERRALKSRARRALGMYNDATAITSLAISNTEVDILNKEFSVDVTRIPVIKPIMDAYNLMAMMIVDNEVQRVDFLYDDGSNKYETLSFRSLERESDNKDYKQVINLMTKMVR